MKLIVATKETQGQRESDFTWAIDGELVQLGLICARDEREGPDGGCGCGRAFGGLNSHKATTTAIVRDVDGFTLSDCSEAFRSYWRQSGWAELAASPHEADRAADELAAEMLALAEQYPAGTVLERRLDDICTRGAA